MSLESTIIPRAICCVNTLHLSYLLPMWKGKIYLNPSSRHELAQIYTSDIYKELNMFFLIRTCVLVYDIEKKLIYFLKCLYKEFCCKQNIPDNLNVSIYEWIISFTVLYPPSIYVTTTIVVHNFINASSPLSIKIKCIV